MSDSIRKDDIIDVAIIGAGIGGAATAVALQRAGLSVQLFEQAHELREVGGAIIIRDPSMALFKQWGVLDGLDRTMVKIHDIELRDAAGDVEGTMPIQFVAGEGEFAYSVHRADVHNALLSAISDGSIHLDHRLKAIDQDDDHATATFENGHSVRARLVIGADGLRSIVRACIDKTELTFLKMVTHRAIAPASLLPAGMPNDRIRMWSQDRLIIMTLPIRSGTEVAIDAVIPTEQAPERLWTSTSDTEIMRYYADFDPLVTGLIKGRTVDVTTHPVYDKDPIDHWAEGRIVLLGDAAHPMAPMQGQGANQAIQDAGALADALQGAGNNGLLRALDRYQAERAPVTARLQLASRKPPEVKMKAHEPV